MKKITLILILVLASLGSLIAQEQHMEFRGIPIDGNGDQFVAKLEKLGYTKKTTSGASYILNGQFAGSACEVYVICTPVSKKVCKVVLYAPKIDNWYTLKDNYTKMKDQFTKKYGAPSVKYESFIKPYYEGDGYETQALKKKKCLYVSLWEISTGSIAIELSEYCQLKYTYEDGQNIKLLTQENSNNIQNEI